MLRYLNGCAHLVALVVIMLVTASAGISAAEAAPARADGWRTATPEEVGLDSAALGELFDFVRQHQTPVHSLQIVRHGRLALDAYFYPYSAGTRHDVASVTKSITSTLIGLALRRGDLGDVKQPVLSLFPNRPVAAPDARKQRLTLEHLLMMQAGWDCGFEPREGRLVEMRRSSDWIQFMLDLPMVAEPGSRWAYCSGNCHLLSAILTQSTGTNALAFAQRELFTPLGIEDVRWPADPRGNNDGWGDLQLHPRDLAKLGQLLLQRGRWGGRQIVPEAWIETATRAHVPRTSNADRYGYLWWVKGDEFPGMFEAVGRGGQRINVWPTNDLVLVFTGGGFEPRDLGTFILKALKSQKPLPANSTASGKLQQRLAAAAQPPSPQAAPKPPSLAARISGKTFKLSANTLGLDTLSLTFDQPAVGTAELGIDGKRIHFPFGLDGVERFSTNALVNLPVAAKGQWLNGGTFLLQLDLVAGINCYRFKLTFADRGRSVRVALNERTGLLDEKFRGDTQP